MLYLLIVCTLVLTPHFSAGLFNRSLLNPIGSCRLLPSTQRCLRLYGIDGHNYCRLSYFTCMCTPPEGTRIAEPASSVLQMRLKNVICNRKLAQKLRDAPICPDQTQCCTRWREKIVFNMSILPDDIALKLAGTMRTIGCETNRELQVRTKYRMCECPRFDVYYSLL